MQQTAQASQDPTSGTSRLGLADGLAVVHARCVVFDHKDLDALPDEPCKLRDPEVVGLDRRVYANGVDHDRTKAATSARRWMAAST